MTKKQKAAPVEDQAPSLDERAQALYGGVGSPSTNFTHAINLLNLAGFKVNEVKSDFPNVTLVLSSGAKISGKSEELAKLLTEYVLASESSQQEPEPEPEQEPTQEDNGEEFAY